VITMTTIVWANGELAADSRVCYGNRIGASPAKKIHTPESPAEWWLMNERVAAFGLAGDASALSLLKSALSASTHEGSGIKSSCMHAPVEFQALVITVDGSCWLITKEREVSHLYICPAGDREAIGSGEEFAMAALACGKDAIGAVDIACQLDAGSGGPVQVWPQHLNDDEIPF